MKCLFVFLLALCSGSVWSKVTTVSNDPNHPAQYATIQEAVDDAGIGDTIYVHGSGTPYADAVVNKRVVLIGAGYNPSNQFNQATTIGRLSLEHDNAGNDASGTVVSGFSANDIRLSARSNTITGVQLFRNKITYLYVHTNNTIFGNGWVIFNNIIANIDGGGNTNPLHLSAANVAILNNIINAIYGFSDAYVIIDHNLFLGPNNLNRIYHAAVSNNVFVRNAGEHLMDNVYACTFTNNLSNRTPIGNPANYISTDTFAAAYTGGGTNDGTGNWVGLDALFETVTDFNTYAAAANYRLRAGSPGKNAGADGTDIGIYGGANVFPTGGAPGSGFDTSPVPPLPQVTLVEIQTPAIQPGGTLRIRIRATINN